MKPENKYRDKIDVVLNEYFHLEREVYSTCGKRIDYILQCKKSHVLFGVEVKKEEIKQGHHWAKYLDQAAKYSQLEWLTSFSLKPEKVLIFITPAFSRHFVNIEPHDCITHNGYTYVKSKHKYDDIHSNTNGLIGGLCNIGEIQSAKYGNKDYFYFKYKNWIIWNSRTGNITEHYSKYNPSHVQS